MGIKGLNKWLHSTGASQDLSKNSPLSSLKTDHLLIDINGLLHQAYEAQDPSLNRTLDRTMQKLEQVVRKFKPHKSLTIVFDGFAPLAKLQTQKERRSSYALVENEFNSNRMLAKIANSSDTGATDRVLSEGEITAGSPYLLKVEQEVVQCVTKKWMKKKNDNEDETNDTNNQNQESKDDSNDETEDQMKKPFLPNDLEFFLSSSTLVGEGEVKISQRLQLLAEKLDINSSNENSEDQENNTNSKAVTPNDNIIIFGSDSDLVIVGLLAVHFHNIWIVHPSMGQGTSLGFLMLKWMDEKRSADVLRIEQLPSARVDFAFLMQLAGGDFYTGLESEDAMKLWNRYKQKRSSPHGFHQRLVLLPSQQKEFSSEAKTIVVASAPPPKQQQQQSKAATATSSPSPSQQQEQQIFSPIYHQSQPRINAEFFKQVIAGGSNNHDDHYSYINGSGGGGRNNKRYQPSKGRTPNQRMKTNTNKSGRNSGNAGQGANVCSFALWSLELLMMGRCEALGVAPSLALNDQAVSLASLQAFAKDTAAVTACRPRRTAIQGFSSCIGVERPPLFTFIAVCARPSHLPIYVQQVLEENPQIRAKLFKKNITTAVMVELADSVLTLTKAHVSANAKQFESMKDEIQTLLMNTADPSHCGYEFHKKTGTTSSTTTISSLITKNGDDLVKMVNTLWNFGYKFGTELQFRGLDRGGKEISLNIVDKTKKKDKTNKNNSDDDNEEEDEEEYEEEEYQEEAEECEN